MHLTNFEKYLESKIVLPEYWYHGSNKYFENFSLEYAYKNWKSSSLGIYFTNYLKPGLYGSTAKEYAEYAVSVHGGKPYIYKCKIDTKNPLMINTEGWYSSNTYIDKNRSDIKRWMENGNNDSVIGYNIDSDYKDFILATSHLDIITIVSVEELK